MFLKRLLTLTAAAALAMPSPAASATGNPPSGGRMLIVTAGDSIVAGSGVDAGKAWPDYLKAECGVSCRVENVAVGGTCLVSFGCGWPTRLLDSFDRDVLSRRPDLILVGVGRNDLCHTPTRAFLAGFRDLRARARAAGVPIRFTTITPVAASWQWPCEEQRIEVNTWLRTLSGTVDFEARTSTPHGLLRSRFDSGDGLHMNARAYRALGRMAARSIRFR